ncbi:MAG: hypothetical protein ACKVTZ_07120 [Bacteroidia bacterium]
MLVPYGKMKYPLSDPLNGVKMFGNPMSMEEMLKYKAIVMLEGNDVISSHINKYIFQKVTFIS